MEATKVWDIKLPDLSIGGYHLAWIERQVQKQNKAWGKKIDVGYCPRFDYVETCKHEDQAILLGENTCLTCDAYLGDE